MALVMEVHSIPSAYCPSVRVMRRREVDEDC